MRNRGSCWPHPDTYAGTPSTILTTEVVGTTWRSRKPGDRPRMARQATVVAGQPDVVLPFPAARFTLEPVGLRIDPTAGRPVGEPFAITDIQSPALSISSNVGQTEMFLTSERLGLTMQSRTGNVWMVGGVDR